MKSQWIVVAFVAIIHVVASFHYLHTRILPLQRPNAVFLSRYVPPELDEEYATVDRARGSRVGSMPKQELSNAEVDPEKAQYMYPLPKEGDIVECRGRWGDKTLGRIRFMRFLGKENGFFAEVVPMMEGKSTDVYVVNTASKAEFVNIADCRPVRALYVRADNGYKVQFTNAAKTELAYRATQYRTVDRSYKPPRKVVNLAVLESDFREYEALKYRVLLSTVQAGVLIAAALAAWKQSPGVVAAYAVGVLGSCLYFYLLGKKVDEVGAAYSVYRRPGAASGSSSAAGSTADEIEVTGVDSGLSELTAVADGHATAPRGAAARRDEKEDAVVGGVAERTVVPQGEDVQELLGQYAGQRLTKLGANARLAVPALVLLLLALKDRFVDGVPPSRFHFVSREEFLGAMGGFLTLRVALFANEVRRELRGEDLLGFVPGSLATALRLLFTDRKVEDRKGEGGE